MSKFPHLVQTQLILTDGYKVTLLFPHRQLTVEEINVIGHILEHIPREERGAIFKDFQVAEMLILGYLPNSRVKSINPNKVVTSDGYNRFLMYTHRFSDEERERVKKIFESSHLKRQFYSLDEVNYLC